jgi:hypothetical protein
VTSWTDPQALLLGDLWREAAADLRFVIGIRNPLETALALRERHAIDLDRGFALCETYFRCAAELVPAERRLVIHYDACLLEPAAQAARVFVHAGVPSTAGISAAALIVAPERRRFRASVLDFLAAQPPRDLLDLYMLFCLEAGYRDADVLEATFDGRSAGSAVTGAARATESLVRVEELAEEREQFRVRVEASEARRGAVESQLERLSAQLEEARRRAEESNERCEDFELRLGRISAQLEEAQRRADEQTDAATRFLQSLRSALGGLDPDGDIGWLDETELVGRARMSAEERNRLRESNGALLEELHAVNQHRAELVRDITSMRESESWRIGRVLTWPARLLRRSAS